MGDCCTYRERVQPLIFWLTQKSTSHSTGTEELSALYFREVTSSLRRVSQPLLQTQVLPPSVPGQHIPLLKPDMNILRKAGNNSYWAHTLHSGIRTICVTVTELTCLQAFPHQPISLTFFLKSKHKVASHQKPLDNLKSQDIINYITPLPQILT